MPVFHFHTADFNDDEGTELPDIATAKCEAIKLAGALICEDAGNFWDKEKWVMTVTNGNGLPLLRLQMVGTEAPALKSQGAPRPA